MDQLIQLLKDKRDGKRRTISGLSIRLNALEKVRQALITEIESLRKEERIFAKSYEDILKVTPLK